MLRVYVKLWQSVFLQRCEAFLVFSEDEDLLGFPLLWVCDLRSHWQNGCCPYLHLKQTKT